VRLQSERNFNPVPDHCRVIRLVRPPKDFNEKGKISAIQLNAAFCLSSDDKKSTPPHLSVWIDSLTTSKQAFSFLVDRSLPRILLRLSVEDIRKIVGCSGNGGTHPNFLNVIWVHIFQNLNGKETRDCHPGAAGHSGIIGLHEGDAPNGLTRRQAENLRKDLRAQLAEIASKDYFMMTEE
jgi:hypothetical protein